MGGGGKMNTEGIPSCEWPDAKRPATFRNCCDKDGRVDNDLREIAAEKRIKEIREQSNAGKRLTNRKRKELYHEADRFERMFKLGRYSPVQVGKIDERKEKATEKKLRWLGKKKDDQTISQDG
jgi:hypothetical protein